MLANYTKDANDRCFHILDEDIYRIWDTVEGLSESEPSGIWKKKCESLSLEYSFSSRFALLRLMDRKNLYKFPLSDMDVDAVRNMGEEELQKYASILRRVAFSRDSSEANYSAYLIAKAFRDAEQASKLAESAVSAGTEKKELNRIRKESKTMLLREEAFQLGHALGFTLEEMSWFLLRVFDFEDGFRYNSSSDLIEAYVFLTDGSWKDAERLRKAYEDYAASVPKADVPDRSADWTQGTEIPQGSCGKMEFHSGFKGSAVLQLAAVPGAVSGSSVKERHFSVQKACSIFLSAEHRAASGPRKGQVRERGPEKDDGNVL